MAIEKAYGMFECPLHPGCLKSLHPLTKVAPNLSVTPEDLCVCDDVGVIEGVLPIVLFIKCDGVWSRWDHEGRQEEPRKWVLSKDPLIAGVSPEDLRVWESHNNFLYICQELSSVAF